MGRNQMWDSNKQSFSPDTQTVSKWADTRRNLFFSQLVSSIMEFYYICSLQTDLFYTFTLYNLLNVFVDIIATYF